GGGANFILSVQVDDQGRIVAMTTGVPAGTGLTGSGSTNDLAIWTSSSALGNSGGISEDGSGNVTLTAGKNFTGGSGAGAVDLSSMTGLFKSPTGAGTLSGSTAMASGKTFTGAGGQVLATGGKITGVTVGTATG